MTEALNNAAKMPVIVTPYRHQTEAYEYVSSLFGLNGGGIKSRGAALLMEMGTGKTLTSIGITGRLLAEGQIHHVLIVAPLSVVTVWRDEFASYAAFNYELAILSGSKAQKAETLKALTGQKLQVAVVNYESARLVEAELAHWKPDFIIADEGHKIKTHNAAVSKTMHRLGTLAKYRLLLTGTPVTNKALDVFSEYKFLNPYVFGSSFYAFRSKYFFMTGYGNYTPVLKKSMEPELERRLHSIAFRATKAECLDLPETTDIIHSVNLEPRAMKIYQNLVKDSYSELANGGEVTVTNVLTQLLRLSQLTGGFIGNDEDRTTEQISNAKLAVLEDIIDAATEEARKLVVIARFVPELRAISKLLEAKGIRYSLIMGGVKNRDEQVVQFQNDPAVSVFLGQIATAGLGITLTASSYMVFYSLDYSMSNFEQTKARIHRAGQRHPCTYLYLTARGTVDEKVLNALKAKKNLAKLLVDDCRSGYNPFK